MSEAYIEIDRNILRERLVKSVLMVYFDKLNGDPRVMTCTLDKRYLPMDERDKIDASNAIGSGYNNAEEKTLHYVRVWDLKANGWRSFRLDRVISIDEVSYP